MHAPAAVAVVDIELLAVPFHALRGTVVDYVRLDIHAALGVFSDGILVELDAVAPGADEGHVGAGDGSHAVVRATGELELVLIGEGRPVDLVLVVLSKVVTGPHGVVTGPLASSHPETAARCSDRGAGATDVEIDLLERGERRLELSRSRAQKDDVAGGAVHVGEAGAMLVPQVTDLSQGVGVVEPTGRLIDAHGMEVCDLWILLRKVGIPADYAGPVTHHTYNPTVLPMADLLLVRLLELAEEVPAHRARLCGHHDLYDEAGPWPFLELVELACLG